jgi:hypothetical protein
MEENKKVTENNSTKERIQINIDNTDDALNWLERLLKLLQEYGPWKIIGATCLITVVSAFLYFTLNFNKTLEIYDAWKIRQHDAKMEMRMNIGPKIQSLADKLTYRTNAARTVILEMHNGNTGSGGLPFTKCTATYESLNIGVYPVSEQYQDVNMSLMPFVHTLIKQGYWCGNTDKLEKLDRGLYYKLKSNNAEHFAACVIEGLDDKPIAFLFLTFNEKQDSLKNHDCQNTRENIRHVAMELSVILEVSRIIND